MTLPFSHVSNDVNGEMSLNDVSVELETRRNSGNQCQLEFRFLPASIVKEQLSLIRTLVGHLTEAFSSDEKDVAFMFVIFYILCLFDRDNFFGAVEYFCFNF